MTVKKQTYKLIANTIVLLSIVFLVVYLHQTEQFVWLKIKSLFLFALSIIFILAGFLMESLALRIFMRKDSINFSYKESVIITGRFILTKYIPGKLGMIVGKASYLKDKTEKETKIILQDLFFFQVLILIGAMITSIIPLFTYLKSNNQSLLFWILGIILLVIIGTQKNIQNFLITKLNKIFKNNLLTNVPPKTLYSVLALLVLNFTIWSIGFYIMAASLGIEIDVSNGFLFAFAAFVGVIVLIAPGGLGVREGIIVAGLVFYGLPEKEAISLSAFSRIWFLGGELLIFLISVLLMKIRRKILFINNSKNQNIITQ
ncbi:MAG: lysylphosphatidylglycerol synthase domain-containing protein [Candidatus Woesearchaeota archaeon]